MPLSIHTVRVAGEPLVVPRGTRYVGARGVGIDRDPLVQHLLTRLGAAAWLAEKAATFLRRPSAVVEHQLLDQVDRGRRLQNDGVLARLEGAHVPAGGRLLAGDPGRPLGIEPGDIVHVLAAPPRAVTALGPSGDAVGGAGIGEVAERAPAVEQRPPVGRVGEVARGDAAARLGLLDAVGGGLGPEPGTDRGGRIHPAPGEREYCCGSSSGWNSGSAGASRASSSVSRTVRVRLSSSNSLTVAVPSRRP